MEPIKQTSRFHNRKTAQCPKISKITVPDKNLPNKSRKSSRNCKIFDKTRWKRFHTRAQHRISSRRKQASARTTLPQSRQQQKWSFLNKKCREFFWFQNFLPRVKYMRAVGHWAACSNPNQQSIICATAHNLIPPWCHKPFTAFRTFQMRYKHCVLKDFCTSDSNCALDLILFI